MIRRIIKSILVILKSRTRRLLKVNKVRLHGVWIDLTHNNISPELKNVFYNESYEADEVEILSKYLSNNDVVMEIGAGIGFLSAYCAKEIGDTRVFAYEANPFMISKIEETYKLNNIHPIVKNTLLSNKEELIDFFLENNFWSSSTVKRSENSKCVSVKSTEINNEISLVKPTFLIIDIEGGEKDLIPIIDFENNSIQKIIIEIHPHVIGEYMASKIIEFIISQGFYYNFKESKGIVCLFERELNNI